MQENYIPADPELQDEYPFRARRRRYMHINLPVDDNFDSANEDLYRTLVLIERPADGCSYVLTSNRIQRHFAYRYGGGVQDYVVHRKSDSTYLIQLPYHLEPSVVMQQNRAWAEGLGMILRRYNNNWRSFPFSIYRIGIKIHDYPMEYWNEAFFRWVISGFGTLVEVVPSDDMGRFTRGTLRMWIECRDPFEIPEFLIFDFWRAWCECRVEVDGWRMHAQATCPVEEGVRRRNQRDLPPVIVTGSPESLTVYQLVQNAHSRYLRRRYGDGGGGSYGGDGRRTAVAIQTDFTLRPMGAGYGPGVGELIPNHIGNSVGNRGEHSSQWSKANHSCSGSSRKQGKKQGEQKALLIGDGDGRVSNDNVHACQIETFLESGSKGVESTGGDRMDLEEKIYGLGDDEACSATRNLINLGRELNGPLLIQTNSSLNIKPMQTEPHFPTIPFSNTQNQSLIQIPLTMNFTDDELLAQFAALSADDLNPALENIPQQPAKSRQ